MSLFSQAELRILSESASSYSVSIYMPTHVAGPDIQQDSIRLKNLLGEAENKLLHAGMPQQDVSQVLKPASSLIEDEQFWRHQNHGLVLFLTPKTHQIYRLPLRFEPLVVVSNGFHLKPLFPLISNNRYFYVLALSQNRVQFFQATRYQISEIFLEGLPSSLADALKYDDPEKQLQYHSTGGGGSKPIYHGQGVNSDADKEAIRRFLSQVQGGLSSHIKTEEAPLVIAAVEYLQSIYRAVNTYPHLLDEGIEGNPDQAKPDELREAAWNNVATLVEQSHQEALEQYAAKQGTGETGNRLSQLLTAAFRGQIDTLFVAADVHHWGTFDPASGQMEEHDQAQAFDRDLLDVVAVQTFLQGGTVYVLDTESMPEAVSAAALYRYAIPAEG